MPLTLHPIHPNENKSNPIFNTDECQNILQMWEAYYHSIGFEPPWIGYFIQDHEQIVGTCAFTGKPVNHRVEVSYYTFPAHEGKGIATWACKALVALAYAHDPTIIIFAKTAPENNASTSILKKNAFVFSGIVQDHEIGDAWEWTLPK